MATTHFKGPLVVDGFYNSPGASTVTTTTTLTVADSGKTYMSATDNQVWNLPASVNGGVGSTIGVTYTFINSGADGAAKLSISPGASDAIHGTITLAASVVELSGADNKDLINTKATATTGNSVTIMNNGVDWFVISSTGIWASEA
jgi:hypothetical protein